MLNSIWTELELNLNSILIKFFIKFWTEFWTQIIESQVKLLTSSAARTSSPAASKEAAVSGPLAAAATS